MRRRTKRKKTEQAPRPTATILYGIGRALSFSPPLSQGHFANLREARAAIWLESFSPTGDILSRGLKFERRTTTSCRHRRGISIRIKIAERLLPWRYRYGCSLRRLAGSTSPAHRGEIANGRYVYTQPSNGRMCARCAGTLRRDPEMKTSSRE